MYVVIDIMEVIAALRVDTAKTMTYVTMYQAAVLEGVRGNGLEIGVMNVKTVFITQTALPCVAIVPMISFVINALEPASTVASKTLNFRIVKSVKLGFTMAAVPCSVGTVKSVQLVIKLMDLVQMAVQIYTSLRFA